jgi:hypothetical protein
MLLHRKIYIAGARSRNLLCYHIQANEFSILAQSLFPDGYFMKSLIQTGATITILTEHTTYEVSEEGELLGTSDGAPADRMICGDVTYGSNR